MNYWDVSSLSSIAPLIPDGLRCGIYVLEFADGSQYVGQSLNVVTRFNTHRHGSRHHEPWPDIVRLGFESVAPDKLDSSERKEMRKRQRAGINHRNKTFNAGHAQPSHFDEWVTPEEQKHWSTGDAEYGWPLDDVLPTDRSLGISKLAKSKLDPEYRLSEVERFGQFWWWFEPYLVAGFLGVLVAGLVGGIGLGAGREPAPGYR